MKHLPWYYAVFPVSATAGLVAATTGTMIAAVGVLTALAWIVIDPLLATTGIHRRRLDRFVTALGEELRGGPRGDYRVRDHLSLSRLNHWLPRAQTHPDMLQGTAALATTVDRRAPPPLVERLGGSLWLQGPLRTAWLLRRHEDRHVGERARQAAQILPPPPGLTITHNFCELWERPKGQVLDNKKGAADNKL